MIKNSTSIAILMATYNGEQFIREQLDSLFAQTYTDWTLFVRDDGSTDNTITITLLSLTMRERISVLL